MRRDGRTDGLTGRWVVGAVAGGGEGKHCVDRWCMGNESMCMRWLMGSYSGHVVAMPATDEVAYLLLLWLRIVVSE